MYMNKNKGFSIIETLSVTIVVLIILELGYFYLKQINLEKKKELYRTKYNKNIKLTLNKIEKSIYESLDYKIYNLNKIDMYLDYSKPSLKNGNTLIIEKYIPSVNYTEIEIYLFEENYLSSFSGKKIRINEIEINQGSREKILDKLNILFVLEEYGVSMKGYYLNEIFKKEFKK
ncbi:hypothetical protein ACQ9ZF_08565 [Cetobacterium somerae]|uniref:hypothetical protein n=1 Tax=Cetobacterium somerae TaxID=188913 RepID=UPI003D769948